MQAIKLEKSFFYDYCDWQDEIVITMTDAMQSRLDQAKQILRKNEFLISVDVEIAEDAFDKATADLLFEQCPFDVHYFQVYQHGFSYYLQAKYDSHVQAEYVFA